MINSCSLSKVAIFFCFSKFNQLIELFGKLDELFINILEKQKLQDGWNNFTLTIQENDLW